MLSLPIALPKSAFHGLLDWRLGLAFLKALASPNYQCGLDGNFVGPELADWKQLVEADLVGVSRRFNKAIVRDVGSLRAVKFDQNGAWGLIAHPLWEKKDPSGLLAAAAGVLLSEGVPFMIVDSFNLTRRPVTVREALRGGS